MGSNERNTGNVIGVIDADTQRIIDTLGTSERTESEAGFGGSGTGGTSGGTAGGTAGNSSGDTRRGRGRPPRNSTQEVNVSGRDNVTSRYNTKVSKKTGIITAENIANQIAICANLIAIQRSHTDPLAAQKWSRTSEQCEPLAVPLTEVYNNLDKSLKDSITKVSLPISILVGAFLVFGEPIAYEFSLFEQRSKSTKGKRTEKAEQSGERVIDHAGTFSGLRTGTSPFEHNHGD